MDRVRKLIEDRVAELKLDLSGLSTQLGYNHAYLQQYLRRGVPTELKEVARERLAPLLGVNPSDLRATPAATGHGFGEQSAPFSTLPPSNVRPADDKPPLPDRHTMPRDVPVYGTAAGGNGDGCFELNQGDPIDFVRRGPGIAMARQVYCIYVEGESMEPWKEPGQLIYLDPARKVRVGDYVVTVVDGPSHGEPPRAYLKRLVRRSPERTTFQQYNPAKEVIFETSRIKSITRVLTMEEVLGV